MGDFAWVGQILPLADRITSFLLVIIFLIAGSRGMWVYGWVAKERMAEKDTEIKRLRDKTLEQERLIDRLSGLAERSTELARPVILSEFQEHRAHKRAARDE